MAKHRIAPYVPICSIAGYLFSDEDEDHASTLLHRPERPARPRIGDRWPGASATLMRPPSNIVTTSEFNHPIRSMSYDHLQSVINSYYWHKHKGNGMTSTAHTHICRLCSLLQGHQFGLRFCVLNC